ncbi:MAG: oligosaccharide flippase family protein [Chitinophagales bacterium]
MKSIISGKFQIDLIWNLASFVLIGVSGILINIIVGRFFGAAILGAFNQVFALYIFMSQLAVLGIQYSTLKYISEFKSDNNLCAKIILSACLATSAVAAIVVLLSWFISPFIEFFFDSKQVMLGFLCVLPGIWLFAVNKVFLNIINGLREMKLYAVANLSRVFFMLLGVILTIYLDVDGWMLPIVITISEAILFLGCITFIFLRYQFVYSSDLFLWAKKHFVFGLKGFFGGAMGEINTRVDVIMLGIFTSDLVVGVYSMASMVAEGVYQISIVVRNNVNPLITEFITTNQHHKLLNLIQHTRNYFYLAMALIGLSAILAYPIFLDLLVADASFDSSYEVFVILVFGIVCIAGYLPFEMILVQCGYPKQQSFMKGTILLTNIILNLALIPLWGGVGAAVASSIAFVFSGIYIKVYSKKVLLIDI